MRPDIARLLPVGLDWPRERKWLLWGLGLAALYGLGNFMLRFIPALGGLYIWRAGVRILDSAAVMQPFGEVFRGSLLGFSALGLCMPPLAAWHYALHRQGSRSIYLMRRLPDGMELHRRCLAVPLIALLVSALAALALAGLCLLLYELITPAQCLAG